MIRVLSQADVDVLLSQGDASAALDMVDLMAETFATYTATKNTDSKSAQAPQRIGVITDAHKVLFMPSRLHHTTSVKVVSVPIGDTKGGLPGTTLVLDETTGSVEAVMNAAALTAVRTAAGSALATRYFASEKAKHLVVLGAGAQGRAHIDMMLAVRPSIEYIWIWNRGTERRDKLIRQIQAAYPSRRVAAAEILEDAVRQADIVCTCTNASEPVLFGAWLKDGVHLNCVGSYTLDMHEVDADTVKRATTIVVDSIEACKAEAGELVKSSQPENWQELGQVVIDGQAQRSNITLFKSVGISVQDSAISGLIVKRAKQANLGSVVPF
ncbi:hypothetical protein DFQ28_010905 [Apophysomyces sp. BC1034]|nr:hypothetical protein DFQ30_010585 [Apophysomyces sp. BC1015]KAG0170145.1 hypothetical protein DFQ29_009417 [Apophysomyces sp. BC1021]KAG0184565.1 hypothetical protein DFQ28_010905 [Apophysomyces sp. BC1034]